MTIKEAVTATIGTEVNDKTIDLNIVNAGYIGTDEYNATLEVDVARIAYKTLYATILMIDSLKEGDLTISYSREGIERRLLFLSGEYGFTEPVSTAQPKIRNKSFLW